AALDVDGHAAHAGGLQKDGALERLEGGGAVAGALRRDAKTVRAGVVHDLHHVLRGLDGGDQRRVLVGGEVPGQALDAIGLVARRVGVAREARAKVIYSGGDGGGGGNVHGP